MKDSEIKIVLKECLKKAFCFDKDTDSPHYRLKKALEDAGKEMFVCPFTRITSNPRKYTVAMKRLSHGVVELELYTLCNNETLLKEHVPGIPRLETMRICEGLLLSLWNYYKDREGRSFIQFLYYKKQVTLRVYSDVEINKLYKDGGPSGIVYRNTL